MDIERFDNPREFCDAASPFLYESEVENSLLTCKSARLAAVIAQSDSAPAAGVRSLPTIIREYDTLLSDFPWQHIDKAHGKKQGGHM